MFKKRIINYLSILTLTLSIALPNKKAEAAILLSATGAGNAVVIGVVASSIATVGLGVISELQGSAIIPVGLAMLTGVTLLFLDEETHSFFEFKTIPPYLMRELEWMIEIKANITNNDINGIKEIIFSNTEVDELFQLADEETSLEELNHLRLILTEPTL